MVFEQRMVELMRKELIWTSDKYGLMNDNETSKAVNRVINMVRDKMSLGRHEIPDKFKPLAGVEKSKSSKLDGAVRQSMPSMPSGSGLRASSTFSQGYEHRESTSLRPSPTTSVSNNLHALNNPNGNATHQVIYRSNSTYSNTSENFHSDNRFKKYDVTPPLIPTSSVGQFQQRSTSLEPVLEEPRFSTNSIGAARASPMITQNRFQNAGLYASASPSLTHTRQNSTNSAQPID